MDAGAASGRRTHPVPERYDYKGARPPFARQLLYLEVLRDASIRSVCQTNRGRVLVLEGADCSKCKRPVCSACSVHYAYTGASARNAHPTNWIRVIYTDSATRPVWRNARVRPDMDIVWIALIIER
ncbi:hypothetical protein HN011_008996 [Eciton burchellii]|nr:hypothetical protein HN011_008996 [Eciton burchellii]